VVLAKEKTGNGKINLITTITKISGKKVNGRKINGRSINAIITITKNQR